MMTTTRMPSHPGQILSELYMGPLDISQAQLADVLHVTGETINEIVNQIRPVSPDLAVRLSYAFSNTSATFWLNLQANYDLWWSNQNAKQWPQIKKLYGSTIDHAEEDVTLDE